MSELRRWVEDGATAEERRLLDASRRERPPRAARTRVLVSLGAAGSVVSTSTTAASAMGGAALAVKMFGVAVVVSGLAAGALVVRQSWRHSTTAASVPAETYAPAETRALATPQVKAESPAAAAVVRESPGDAARSTQPTTTQSEEVRHAPASRSISAAAPTGSLSLEVAALERAHKALGKQDPNAALRELDRYRTQFPNGTLASEETVLRVQALLALGDRSGAQSLAESYIASHSNSPYARRIQELMQITPSR